MKNLIFFVLTFVSAFTYAQVGIDTKNPEQALHVDGKVKIADDDNAPTSGTLRYSEDGDFEGFSGKGWISLTQGGASGLPSNPVPVYGYRFAVGAGVVRQDATIRRFVDGTGFTTVPAGKFLLVTSVHIEPNGLNQTGTYEVTVGRGSGTSIEVQSALRIAGGATSQLFQDPLGILLIVREGESLKVTNESSSDFSINLKARGFLVDDLDYQ
ncbi:MAG: hypothetical protein AAGA95_15630 [Pseudomonadota bacterium]